MSDQKPPTPVPGPPEIRKPSVNGFSVGQVVEYDYEAAASLPCPAWTRCRGNHTMAILEARRKVRPVGQVVEVTEGHVDVIWENGRWASYGPFPYLGSLAALRPSS